jgi:protein SCO1/2
MSSRTRRLAVPVLLLLVGLAALTTALYLAFAPPSRPTFAAAAIGGPFELVSQDGKPVTDRDFLGAPHLVFFGFTHCPDVCPTKLFEISEVFRALGDRGKGVKALFITVDPERDTPDAMRAYVASFDPRIVGLTGDRESVDKAIRSYRAYAKKVPLKDGDYTMEHTALVYLMDKGGRFAGSFNLERPPEQAAQDLLRQL